jgi:hypothetical protein
MLKLQAACERDVYYYNLKFELRVKEDEMGRACSTNGGEEEHI